ncbi:hypothetical protein JCM11641_004871 [Rhodosporidiobolus odoratus]
MSKSNEHSAAELIAPNNLPVALRLPLEIGLNILPYFHTELHKARRICKTVDAMNKSKRFDKVLFRCGPPAHFDEKQKSKLHPLPNALDCILCKPMCAYLQCTYGEGPNAFGCAAMPDFVTQPACTEILSFVDGAAFDAFNPQGITIQDFLGDRDACEL